MRFYKLRVTPNVGNIASTFNAQFEPEIIQEQNDPFRVDWITEPSDSHEILVGDKVILFKTISLDCAADSSKRFS
jgi:actin-related protein 8